MNDSQKNDKKPTLAIQRVTVKTNVRAGSTSSYALTTQIRCHTSMCDITSDF